jgi:EAL domain-containing protein (putative c-di-GMP-specific phosphodiesterase class I)
VVELAGGHAACQAVRDWQRRFPLERPPFLSVNLSMRQLQQPDLLEDVADALDASGLDPGELLLEITCATCPWTPSS